jgi:RNA polymerase sigma-70 factor (ECF subfamily)
MTDAQLLASLEHCLDQLVPELRMMLVMRFTEGLSYDDLSRICRAKPEAVRARVSRAMPVLRRCLEQRGTL